MTKITAVTYDAGTLELDNEAVVTKARVFLDSLT